MELVNQSVSDHGGIFRRSADTGHGMDNGIGIVQMW